MAPKNLRNYGRRIPNFFGITRSEPPTIFRIARGVPRWLAELRAMPPENIPDYVRCAPRALAMVLIIMMYHELTKALEEWLPFCDSRVGRKTLGGLVGGKVLPKVLLPPRTGCSTPSRLGDLTPPCLDRLALSHNATCALRGELREKTSSISGSPGETEIWTYLRGG